MKTRVAPPTLLAATVALVSSFAFAGPRDSDANVIRSTQQSIQIEFNPKYYQPKLLSSNGTVFQDYDFEGSSAIATYRDPGVPDLKYKNLPLAFQSKDNNAVQVVAADYEEIPNVLLKPMPTLEIKDGMLVVKEYSINSAQYGQNTFLPGTIAQLGDIELTRSMLIGGVKIFPVQYNPATKTLRRYSRIVVEVVYGTSSATRVQNDDDGLFGPILLNANEARPWKFGKPQSLNRTTGAPSVLAQGNWYRLTVADEGMYSLDANWFSSNGITLSTLDPRTIKIYGNGGMELSENVAVQRPVDLVENAIHVEGEADGQFNAGDYVLFYGKGIQGIKYDASAKTLRHYIHHYSRVNYYWLTFGGGATSKRMVQQPTDSRTPTVVPGYFSDAVWVEPDTVNLIKSGKNWLSFPVNSGASISRALPMSGLVQELSRVYRFTLVGGSPSGSSFNVSENGASIGTFPLFGFGGYEFGGERTFEVAGSFPVQSSTSQLSFQYSGSVQGWLDWVEIIYPRTFDPVGNYLRFRSPDTNGVVEYRLGQFSGAVSIFDVTDYANVRRLTGFSGTTFRANQERGGVSEYCAVSGAYKTPTGATRIEPQNLRGIADPVPYDFIILTSQEFLSAANRLKEHRQSPANGGLKTIVVDVNKIYNEFSGGVPDIAGIRDFLKYAYENWSPQSPPKFVCFFGQGSYDYKAIHSSRSSYVPTWQRTDYPYHEVENSSSDDFFVRFTANSSRPSMVTGRLNPRSVLQGERLVDRIIGYDTRSEQDAWKMRGLFVGDDGWVEGRNEEGNIHTSGAEDIANLTPDIFEKRKVYLEEYPTVITGQGRRKPGAYQDIIDIINRGVLLVNFTGHGNPTVWTHESVFTTQTSIPQLNNANRLAYFFGATCNFSQFDDPDRETGTELLINRVEGGAIGAVSATRKVYSNSNESLNRGIYNNMFRQDQFGRVNVERVATALYLFKAGGGSGDNVNDEKYFVLGDPTMRLQYPRNFAKIDSINGSAVEVVNGSPRVFPIQLKSLERITVKGTIRNSTDGVDSTYNGRLTLEVNDATRNVVIPAYNNWGYSVVGATIYRGDNSVSQGKFTSSFIVPKDIAYADSSSSARLVTYFTSDTSDGAGYTSRIWIGGTDTSAANTDSVGPSLKILLGASYENSLTFRQGDVVNEKPTLFVDLVDSSGINTSNSGVGHRIEAWLNNNAQSIDMTGFYTSKLNSFQAGTVTYPLRDLSQGRNTIKVRAWDTYNNAQTTETFFEVMSSDQLSIVEVMNYPNPFTKQTVFTFRHNQAPVPVSATVKIFTIAGRLVRTLDLFSASDAFVSIPWDGRDRDGDEIANGVYLYKVLVRTVDGRFNSEVLGKLAVAR